MYLFIILISILMFSTFAVSEGTANVVTLQSQSLEPQSLKHKSLEYQSKPSLPSPLDLKTALSLAGNRQYPDMQIALSEILQIQSEHALADSKNNFKIGASAQIAATISSSILPDDYPGRNTDHELKLDISKRLYDFGRYSHQNEALNKQFLSASLNFEYQKQSHYLQIMRAFFNVILADLTFSYSNEAMSIVYIQYDRAKIYHRQKKISKLELLRIENEYNQISIGRSKSENEQRIKRSILAILLNAPDQIPSELDIPDLSSIADFSINRELLEIEPLQASVQKNNLQLKKIDLQIEAEKKLQQSYYANKYPVISSRFGTAWYSREMGGDDKAIAALSIEIPIYQGGEVDAHLSASLAKLNKFQAQQSKLKMQLNQQVLEIWMSLKNLKLQYQQLITELNYRELYLDKSRIEYDSELKADLGNAMVKLSKAQLGEKQVLFEIALQWAELDILMGKEDLYAIAQ